MQIKIPLDKFLDKLHETISKRIKPHGELNEAVAVMFIEYQDQLIPPMLTEAELTNLAKRIYAKTAFYQELILIATEMKMWLASKGTTWEDYIANIAPGMSIYPRKREHNEVPLTEIDPSKNHYYKNADERSRQNVINPDEFKSILINSADLGIMLMLPYCRTFIQSGSALRGK